MLGRHSDPAHVLASTEELAARGVELIRVERGGEVTYHGPGQLVGSILDFASDERLSPAVQMACHGRSTEFPFRDEDGSMLKMFSPLAGL
jgi:hypothetical protein